MKLLSSGCRVAMALTLIAVGVPNIAVAQEPSDGMYVRTGLVLDWLGTTRFRDTDCSSISPAALYGCGTGVDGTPIGSVGNFARTGGVELGVGYALESAVRLEAILRYRPNFAFQGRANFVQTATEQSVTADLSSLSGMLAIHRDFPEISYHRFMPFAGIGAGVSRVTIAEMRMIFPRTTTIVPNDQRVNAAWMLTAGLATSLTENWRIDFAWSYSDMGAVETGQAVGHVVWQDRSRGPLALDLGATTADLSLHSVSMSLRYAF